MSGGRNALVLGGLAVAGAGGYYLYTAGGDPKVAQKQIEHDTTVAKSKLKGENISPEAAKKQGEEWAQIAGSKIDSSVDAARGKIREADSKITREVGKAEGKLEQFSKDAANTFEKDKDATRKNVSDGIDKFDKTVERKTSEAKSGLSSWFGFGK